MHHPRKNPWTAKGSRHVRFVDSNELSSPTGDALRIYGKRSLARGAPGYD